MAKVNGKGLGIGIAVGAACLIIGAGLTVLVQSVSSPAEATAVATAPQAGDETTDQTAEKDPDTGEVKPACDFPSWIGKYSGEAEAAAKATGRPVRVLRPQARKTMDFSPSRINIDVDIDDKVTGVHCG